jgi:transposase
MASMPERAGTVQPLVPAPCFGGIDTHQEVHVAAVVDSGERVLGTGCFPTTVAGHRALLGWMRRHGDLVRVGVEGTGSYGAGVSLHLAGEGVPVLEVDRPDRVDRRRRGKDDELDAINAARAALHQQRTCEPKSRDGAVEALRVLRVTRASAVRARRHVLQLLRMTLVSAPDELREQVRDLSRMRLIRACAAWRPDTARTGTPLTAHRIALRTQSRRYLALSEEIAGLDALIDPLVADLAPRLLDRPGIGTEIAGQLLVTAGDNPDRMRSESAFAMLCGVAPLPASSGKVTRHRLNRGGDRQANRALYLAVVTRIRTDPATQAYVERRTGEGLSKLEIIRCLKRYLAREVYHLLNPAPANHHTASAAALRRRRDRGVNMKRPTGRTMLTPTSAGVPSTGRGHTPADPRTPAA